MSWFDTFSELVMEVSTHGKLILMGDFNCNLLKTDSKPTRNMMKILKLANSGLKFDKLTPTRITETSATCIDFIAADKSLKVTSYVVSDFLVSDHLPVETTIEIAAISSLSPIIKRSFKDVNFNDLGIRIANIQLDDVSNATQLDEQLTVWYAGVLKILDEVAPLRNFPRRKQKSPFVDKDTNGLMHLRKSMTRKLKNDTSNPTLQESIKKLKRQIKSRIRASSKSRAKETLIKQQPKSTWKFIRKTTFSQNKKSQQLPNIDELNNFFANLVKPDTVSSVIVSDLDRLKMNKEEFEIRPLELWSTTRLLQQVKPDTSAGPDDIPPFLIQKLAHFMAPNINHLYNSSIGIGSLPSEWKKANVVPVYKKKGSKSELENYRPISILSTLGRILEKNVATQLQEYCDRHSVIPIEQFGFRKNSSCELALLAALENWIQALSVGKYVGVLLIDLSKAFDSINHGQLLQELQHIGCTQQSIQWFSSFFSGRQQRVKAGESTAGWHSVNKGVPQGSPLSPLLFNIMVRDLPVCCNADTFQFADDLSNSAADVCLDSLTVKLQDIYNNVKAFCDKRNLSINLEKTQLIVLKSPRKHLPSNFHITLDNVVISPSSTVKLLGVTLDQHLTMAAHIDMVIKKCHGLLGMLRRATVYLPTELLKLIYTSVIRSHLEYASAVFTTAAQTHLNKLDVIQKIASRIIKGCPPQTHSAPLQLDLGLDSLGSRRNQHVGTIVEKILCGKHHPYFEGLFDAVNDPTCATPKVSKLDSKRFSCFGIRIYEELAKDGGTSNRALKSSSGGRPCSQVNRQQEHTAITTNMVTTVDINGTEAREDH